MTVLKRVSDALLVLAIVLAVVAVFGPSWLWWVAAFCLVDSLVVAWLRRRTAKTRRP